MVSSSPALSRKKSGGFFGSLAKLWSPSKKVSRNTEPSKDLRNDIEENELGEKEKLLSPRVLCDRFRVLNQGFYTIIHFICDFVCLFVIVLLECERIDSNLIEKYRIILLGFRQCNCKYISCEFIFLLNQV
jgi:hypothetical protein